jgi:hypothetical protein
MKRPGTKDVLLAVVVLVVAGAMFARYGGRVLTQKPSPAPAAVVREYRIDLTKVEFASGSAKIAGTSNLPDSSLLFLTVTRGYTAENLEGTRFGNLGAARVSVSGGSFVTTFPVSDSEWRRLSQASGTVLKTYDPLVEVTATFSPFRDNPLHQQPESVYRALGEKFEALRDSPGVRHTGIGWVLSTTMKIPLPLQP